MAYSGRVVELDICRIAAGRQCCLGCAMDYSADKKLTLAKSLMIKEVVV